MKKMTREGTLELADKYTKLCEPKLEEQDEAAVAEVKKTIADNKFSDVFYKKAVDNLISHLTLKLASAKSLDGLAVASAFLVKEATKNRRVLNLFGSVLHSYDKYKEAIVVFQYTLTLDRDNVLTRLNLANAYLDDNKDDKAKALLDKLEFDDRGNKAVYRALATYYYKKKNWTMFKEYLFKAAQFNGYKRKKAEKQQQKVDENEVKQEEPTEAIETKLKHLEDIVPLTTADIIEDAYPDAARQIRDKYGKLGEKEKWVLPKLPIANLNGPPDYKRNEPILKEWMKVNTEKFSVFFKQLSAQSGVDMNAGDKIRHRQAEAAAKKQMAEAMQQTQQMLEQMESMPGITKADIAKAKKELQKALKEQGLKAEDGPANMSASSGGDSSSLSFLQWRTGITLNAFRPHTESTS